MFVQQALQPKLSQRC